MIILISIEYIKRIQIFADNKIFLIFDHKIKDVLKIFEFLQLQQINKQLGGRLFLHKYVITITR